MVFLFHDFSLLFRGTTLLYQGRSKGHEIRFIGPDNYIPGNFLLVIGFSILSTRDFIRMDRIAGIAGATGYVEGARNNARFGYINGIVANPTSNAHIWVSDQDNGCFRTINRISNSTDHLAGGCSFIDIQDGKFSHAGVAYPFGLTTTPTDRGTVYFYENRAHILRSMLKIGSNWYIRTLFYVNKNINGMRFDLRGEFIYFTYEVGILRVSTTWRSPSEEIVSREGHKDGPLHRAEIKQPRNLIFLDNTTFLMASNGYNNLRLFDLKKSIVSSICAPQNGILVSRDDDYVHCRIEHPRQFAISRNSSTIYINGLYAIYGLTYSGRF